MLGHLLVIDKDLADKVIGALGAEGKAQKATPAKAPVDLKPSPALRLYGKFKPTLSGRKVGLLLGAGFDAKIKKQLVSLIEAEGAKAAIVTSKIEGEVDSDGNMASSDMALRASPSVLFDAVLILAGPEGDKRFATDPNAVTFLMDAKRHCKAIGFAGIPLSTKKAGVAPEAGIIDFSAKSGPQEFINAARNGRFWDREEEK